MVPLSTTVTFVAGTPPMLTVTPAVNELPWIVIWVPPLDGPLSGPNEPTNGVNARSGYPPGRVPLCASGFVTTTSTRPAACAPVNASMRVEPTTVTPVASTPPILTAAPGAKLAPVRVTLEPAVPDAGL